MRVLVVDDEPAVRGALDRALRLEGHEVELVGDGERALDALATARPDAVVLDVAPAGPAAGAGIRPGDVITRVGSSEIATVGELLGALRGTRPGQQVPVVVQRGPQSTTLTVTIGQAPG